MILLLGGITPLCGEFLLLPAARNAYPSTLSKLGTGWVGSHLLTDQKSVSQPAHPQKDGIFGLSLGFALGFCILCINELWWCLR